MITSIVYLIDLMLVRIFMLLLFHLLILLSVLHFYNNFDDLACGKFQKFISIKKIITVDLI